MFAVSAIHTNKGIAPIVAKRAAEQKVLERIDREAKAKREIEAQKTEDKRQHDVAKRIKAELIAKQKHLQIIASFREVHIEGISRPRVKDIIDFVALGTNYSFEDIISPQLKREIVELRHYAMFRAWAMRPDLSFPALGREFGGRDHSTIMHAVSKFGFTDRSKALAFIREKEISQLSA